MRFEEQQIATRISQQENRRQFDGVRICYPMMLDLWWMTFLSRTGEPIPSILTNSGFGAHMSFFAIPTLVAFSKIGASRAGTCSTKSFLGQRDLRPYRESDSIRK